MRARRLLVCTLAAAGCGHDTTFSDAGAGDDAAQRDGGSLSSPGIYVTNESGAITVFDLDAAGDAAPVRTITGARTGLSLPIGIAVDRLDNLFVANRTGSTVTVYRTDDEGDVAPQRTLTATGMSSPQGLALDVDDNLYVVTCPTCGTSAGGDTGVYHFPAGAADPDTVVVGGATGLTAPVSIAVSAAGDVVVGNAFGGTIATFADDANGDVAPIRSFTPTASNLQAIARGASTLAITSPGTAIDFYELTATGAASPAGGITTSAVPVEYPAGLYFDGGTIYLADYGGDAVHVITTTGGEPDLIVTEVRTIVGPSTGLDGPLHITIAR